MTAPEATWEERWHPLRQEWVVVSGHRDNRPWHGESVAVPGDERQQYLPDCHLCPGNLRVSGERNPAYRAIHVFDNDHPCVGPGSPEVTRPANELFRNRRAEGMARVVCFTPRHDLALAELSTSEIVNLLRVFRDQYLELGARPEVDHVLIFENRGEAVGVSNPHPHAQIYATNFVFRTIEVEAAASARHLAEHGKPLFEDLIAAERSDGRRVVVDQNDAIAFIPYFARFPYETYVAPTATRGSVATLDTREMEAMAAVLKETLVRLDNLWRMPMPYVLVLHNQPTDGREHPGFHFHIQILPPLRRPGLLKYLAGPELGGGNFLNDAAPESRAAELRAAPDVHYRTPRPHV